MFPLLCESDSHAEHHRRQQHEPADSQNHHPWTACPVGGQQDKAPLLWTVLEEQQEALFHIPGIPLGAGQVYAHVLDEGGDFGSGEIPTR